MADAYRCPRCAAGGHPWSPKCGFLANGVFTDDNWNCATLNALRDVVERTYGFDESIGVVRCDEETGGFVVLTWYKDRGATSNALWVGDSPITLPLTLDIASAALHASS